MYRLIKTTRLLQATVERLRTQGYVTHATLWNTCLFLNLAAHDLSILIEDLALERDVWRRRFIARQVALVAYEITHDMQALLGKTFREAPARLGVLLQFETQLRDARRPLDLFWKQHQADLQHVRTVAAGHRDHDGLAILRVTENINIDTSLVVSSSLGQILDDIAAVLQAIVVQTASLAPPEA